MPLSKIRVYELAKMLDMPNKELMEILESLKVDVKSHMSSIDTETEQLIQNAITRVLKNRTSFIVAHRLSTIRNADRILVISGGKIAEMGTHKQLIKQRGHYYDLYTTQFKEEASDVILR